jgi:hypothetical protein
MRKMMLVVMSVLSLAACGVDPVEDSAPAVQCNVNSDCGDSHACDLITQSCVTIEETAAEPAAPSRFEQALDREPGTLTPAPSRFEQALGRELGTLTPTP